MEHVTIGNVLTISSIILGFVLQYIALVKSFSERITKIEAEQNVKHERIDKDIEMITKDLKLLTSKIKDGDCHENYS